MTTTTVQPYDEIVAWTSEKGAGTYKQFKDAWGWLTDARAADSHHPSAWIVLNDLAALGHLEVAWSAEPRWCAAPPVLTSVARSGGRVLLTGARTRTLLDLRDELSGRLMDVADEGDFWLDRIDSASRRAGPTTIMLACSNVSEASRLADKLGIQWTYSVVETLSQNLPPLSTWERTWKDGELPGGFEVEYFDTSDIRWYETDDTNYQGLYRAKTYSRDVHALYSSVGHWFHVPREQAVYEVLRWDGIDVLGYNRGRMELSVPMDAPLPALQARCAVLSSGLLPLRRYPKGEPAQRVYRNVDRVVAERIADSLAQRLMLA